MSWTKLSLVAETIIVMLTKKCQNAKVGVSKIKRQSIHNPQLYITPVGSSNLVAYPQHLRPRKSHRLLGLFLFASLRRRGKSPNRPAGRTPLDTPLYGRSDRRTLPASEVTAAESFITINREKYMGYVVLHLDKSPSNEAAMTAHIARTQMPPNADPSRTHLNRELIAFPEGVADRTQAINYRLAHAGLTRKIGKNQVKVIRVMLTDRLKI